MALSRKDKVIVGLLIVASFLAGIFAYSFVQYSNDVATTVHGLVIVQDQYGSPGMLEFYTNFDELPFRVDVITPLEVDLAVSGNFTAYYSLIVISGHEYDVDVSVDLFGSNANVAPHDCVLGTDRNCTVCQAPILNVPLGITNLQYNVTVSCPS